ncbi:unnamed protein product [Ambrosiozyma monospora]|uniref:Unnamed protein product n=1 Tax=Ambrosiozyma monospora TaxID=43982 RepID=A0ACB5T6D5_AMBMO|nr:unnamed protein product [Ambrosiozyma monospora]
MAEIMDLDFVSNKDYTIPTNVLHIITRLPFELRCQILKNLILNRFQRPFYLTLQDKNSINQFSEIHSSPEIPGLISSFLGVHPNLDNVMVMALQEMCFDENLLKSRHFDKIAYFVVSRSIKVIYQIIFSNFDSICLLNHLKVLYLEAFVIPRISNITKLDSLREVSPHISTYIVKAIGQSKTILLLERLQVFISNLPKTVESFEFSDCFEISKVNHPSSRLPDFTCFDESVELINLMVQGTVPPSMFGLATIASCQLRLIDLESLSSLSYLPSTLEFLSIHMKYCKDNNMYLSQFLTRYITPLENLLELNIFSYTSGTWETDNIDLR